MSNPDSCMENPIQNASLTPMPHAALIGKTSLHRSYDSLKHGPQDADDFGCLQLGSRHGSHLPFVDPAGLPEMTGISSVLTLFCSSTALNASANPARWRDNVNPAKKISRKPSPLSVRARFNKVAAI